MRHLGRRREQRRPDAHRAPEVSVAHEPEEIQHDVEGDVVHHDRRDDLVRSATPPQEGRQPHPEQSAQHRRRDDEDKMDGRRKPPQAEGGEGGRKRPDIVLAFDPDVEHVDLKPDRGRYAGKDQGGRRREDAGHGAGLHVECGHEAKHAQGILVNREDDRGSDHPAGEHRDDRRGGLQEQQPAARPHGVACPVGGPPPVMYSPSVAASASPRRDSRAIRPL